MRISYVFFGTPEFARPVLDEIERAGRLPLAVVCQPDRPSGRGRKRKSPPVKVWARERSIEVLQPEKQKDPRYLERLGDLAPDLCLVAAFGQILPKRVLDVPRLGFINVHPSLVPRYRGAAPIQWTLINGDEKTGVTILEVTPRLDDGDVLAQRIVDVDPDETAARLQDRLGELGGELAVQVIQCLETGPVEGAVQDESQVVWAPALTKADGRIDWNRPARSIHDRIRGVQPWPGAVTSLRGRAFKIHLAAVTDALAPAGAGPGQVIEAEGDRLLVQTGDGVLRLLEVQAEGKKRMDARAFLPGRQVAAGDVLGG